MWRHSPGLLIVGSAAGLGGAEEPRTLQWLRSTGIGRVLTDGVQWAPVRPRSTCHEGTMGPVRLLEGWVDWAVVRAVVPYGKSDAGVDQSAAGQPAIRAEGATP